MDLFAHLDATAQAELVRRKEVKPVELVDAAIERIERLNPQLNAVVRPMFEQAREQACNGLAPGPFTGVPFLLKDIISGYAGVPTTAGSAFFKDYVPPYDSELVTRLKRAGLVVVGKSNTSEFGILPTTEPHLFGACKNPWSLGHSTGGSSGGAAAAVACGMVPVAHAADGGGSIRIPASCCGLFGLKPTRGRNPLGPDIGDIMGGLVVEHAISRTVRDSAALLDATEGPDVGAPYVAPSKQRPYVQEVGAPPGRLRVRFTTRPLSATPVHPECVRAVETAARLLVDLGHEVDEDSLDVPEQDDIADAFISVWSSGAVLAIDSLALVTGREPKPEDFEPLTWTLYEAGRSVEVRQYLLSVAVLQRYARRLQAKFVDTDVWLTPVLAEPPAPLGTFESSKEEPLAGLLRAVVYSPFTPMANVTGQPAMSVPLHWTSGGLPVGLHFIGRFGDEATLFRLASQLEAARPWASRRPPVFG
jgi:amidase